MRTLRRHVHRQAGANCTDAKLYFWTIFQFFFLSNGTWTHPPTSKLFMDFWNFFNFAKPLINYLIWWVLVKVETWDSKCDYSEDFFLHRLILWNVFFKITHVLPLISAKTVIKMHFKTDTACPANTKTFL